MAENMNIFPCLLQIVDKLQCYVKDGDTVKYLDFGKPALPPTPTPTP